VIFAITAITGRSVILGKSIFGWKISAFGWKMSMPQKATGGLADRPGRTATVRKTREGFGVPRT
jgi:hypothetical protein